MARVLGFFGGVVSLALRRAASQRTGGFDPLTVGWTHAYWAEGPEFVALGLSNGGAVGTFPDEIGTADLTQGTGSAQPAFQSSVAALGNRATVKSDGADWVGPTTITIITQPFSVVVVESGATAGSLLVSTTGDLGWCFYMSGGVWLANAGSTISGGSADSGAHMLRFYANSASSKLAEDETVVVTGNAGTYGAGPIQLFRIPAGFNSAAHLAFVGIYAGDVTTDPKWASFKAWAATHYGLTIA